MVYNHKKLGNEIVDLDQTAHHHSIVAIKDTFQKYPNRYLVYEDKTWNCRFFLNYPMQLTETQNVDFLKQKISGALKIPVDAIELTKKDKLCNRNIPNGTMKCGGMTMCFMRDIFLISQKA